MDKKIQITVIVCSVIGSLILYVIKNKRRQKELEELEKIYKKANKMGEDLREHIRKSSEKEREAIKLWDSVFDYDVEVYDIRMNKTESITIFSTRKEAENFCKERIKQLGSKYLVTIGLISKSHNEEE